MRHFDLGELFFPSAHDLLLSLIHILCDSVLMQGAVVRSGASLAYVIADKNVTINQDRMLMGHLTYPLAIAKESVV